MDQVIGGNGSINDVPWASVFDPAANARALSAIQAEGLRAASLIVERIIGMISSNAGEADGGTPADVELADGADAKRPAVSDLEQLTRAWWQVIGRLLLQWAPGAARANGDAPTLQGVDAEGSVCLEAATPGQASAEVWLHNRTIDDLGLVSLRCSDLMTHDGYVIPSGAVQVEPAIVPVPSRSSRGVAITVDVAPSHQPGLYRGILLAGGPCDLWLPVVLTIRSPAS